MDQGIRPLPWFVPNVPTAGPLSPWQQNKNKGCWTRYRRGSACVALSVLFPQNMTQICDLHAFSIKPVGQCGRSHGIWVHRERQGASCLILLVRPPNASDPLVASAACGPARPVSPPSAAALSSDFSLPFPGPPPRASSPGSLRLSRELTWSCFSCRFWRSAATAACCLRSVIHTRERAGWGVAFQWFSLLLKCKDEY